MTIPICAVTGRIAGDADACGDCDPCGAAHMVPDAVKRLLTEKEERRQKYGTSAAEIERLRMALTKLSNEVLGAMPLLEVQTRRDLGNSNYNILIQRAEEARALLGDEQTPRTCPDGRQCYGACEGGAGCPAR